MHEYDRTHDVFLTKREDTAVTLLGSLAYRLGKRWHLNLQGAHTFARSNIDFYTYDRTVVSLGVTWQY